MENPADKKVINETIKLPENNRAGFEIAATHAKHIASELSHLADFIDHNSPVSADDIENLGWMTKNIDIDVGGEIMSVEDAVEIPDLKKNAEIWKEMCEGNFDNTDELTMITKKYSALFKGDRYIDLSSLTSADGLILPDEVNGWLDLRNVMFPDGLVLPRKVSGTLFLNSLVSAKGLVLPDVVEGHLFLSQLGSAEGLVLPRDISGDIFLDSIESAKGLVFPTVVKGELSLDKITSADGLVLPTRVEGDLSLMGLKSAQGLVLPAHVAGEIHFRDLTSVDGLVLPKIFGAIDLEKISESEKMRLRKKFPQHEYRIM